MGREASPAGFTIKVALAGGGESNGHATKRVPQSPPFFPVPLIPPCLSRLCRRLLLLPWAGRVGVMVGGLLTLGVLGSRADVDPAPAAPVAIATREAQLEAAFHDLTQYRFNQAARVFAALARGGRRGAY